MGGFRQTEAELLYAPAALGQSAAMARLSIRIYFGQAHHGMGPGMAQLLEGVAVLGSIRKSAGAMTMSYHKAWLLIQNMQETFGGAVVTTSIGGRIGGGAQLTLLGKNLLAAYRRIESCAARATAAGLKLLVGMTKARKRTKSLKTKVK